MAKIKNEVALEKLLPKIKEAGHQCKIMSKKTKTTKWSSQ
jgi:hypothetical protein